MWCVHNSLLSGLKRNPPHNQLSKRPLTMSVSTENEDDEMLFETSSAVEAEETPKILRASSSSEHSYVFSIAASNLPQPQDLNNPVDTRRNSFHEENYEEEGFVENSSEASLNRPNTPPCPCKSNRYQQYDKPIFSGFGTE